MKTAKIINIEKWTKSEEASPLKLAELPLSVEEIEACIGQCFEEYTEHGLGNCYRAFIAIDGKEVFMRGVASKNNKEPGVIAQVHSHEEDPGLVLTYVCELLNITGKDMRWVTEFLSEPKFVLYRIDDNANEIEMKRFHLESSAKWAAEKYSKGGHKQLYLVRRAT